MADRDRDHDGPKHRPSKSHPRHPDRHGAHRRGLHYGVGAFGYSGLPSYGQGFYRGVLGTMVSSNTNAPVSGPAPADMQGPSGHLSPDQFVGYPGGFSTDAGNYTGVQAIEGAAGNGGAGGIGDSGGAPA